MVNSRWREDRGVASVLGIALAFVVMASGLVILAVVALTVGHQRAAVAADLAALAAAAHGCDVAEHVARAQGAISVACSLQGSDAVVTVALPAPEMLGRLAQWAGREAPVIPSASRAGIAQ
jgi:secretion/DNA translocation related TadE-like protein